MVAFGDVLFAATCGLNHLVDSAVAFGEVVLGEVVGDVIDYLSHLIDPEVAVVAVLGEEGGGRGVRIVRSTLSVLNIQSILVVLVVLVFHFSLFYSSTSWRKVGTSTCFHPTCSRVSLKRNCVASSPWTIKRRFSFFLS